MINFRFHIVSLTAVFLALAIGLVLGTAFLDDASERFLERQLDDLDTNLNEARAQNADLEDQLAGLRDEDEALDQQLGPRLFGGQLAGVPVLVVSTRGIEGELVQRVQTAVQEADGELVGAWWLTDRLVLDDDDEVTDLATALEEDTDDADVLRSTLAERLADVTFAATDAPGVDQASDGLDDGGAVAGPGEPALLARLHDAGFVDYELPEDSEDDVVELPAGGLRVVVVSDQSASVPDGEVLLPMLTELAGDSPVPVVVSAPTPTAGEPDETLPAGSIDPLVAAVRGDDALRDRIATVDDLETVAGRIATLLAVHDAVPGAETGHFGRGDGAGSRLPPPPENGEGNGS